MADWRDAIPSVDEFVQRDTPLIPEQPKPAESGMTDWRGAIPDAPGFESAPTPPKEMHRVVAQDTTPDTEAKIAQLSMRSRLPDALIRSDLRTAEAYDEYKRMSDATASTPATARFLSIAENMAAARDDAEALAEVEKSLLGFFGYNFRNTPAQIAKGNVAASYAFDPDNKDELNRYMLSLTGMEKAEVYKLRSELVAGGADPDKALAEAAKQRIGYHRDYWQSVADSENFAIPEQYQVPETFWEKVFAAGGGSAPGMLLTAINAPAGTAWFTQQIYGSEFDSYVKQGVAPERARDAALVSALMQMPLEYAGNVIQLKAVSKALKPGGVKDFLLNVTQGALSEGLEEYLQSYPQLFSSIYATNPDMSAGDALVEFIKQIPDESFQADALESAAVGAGLGGALPGIGGAAAAPFNYRSRREYKEVVEPVVAQQTAVQQSQAEQEALMQLREKVLATKTKARNPRKAEEHIQGILDRSQDVPQEVYIPAARLVEVMDANPGVVAPLLEELELSQGEVAEAAAQGIDLAVSTAKYAAYAMGTDLDTALVNDLRLSPNSMTAAQLAEAEKTFTEDLARHTEALRRKDEARTVIEQERQQVYKDVKRQLVANNVKAPEENAVAMAAAFATMSQRYGNGSPLELYNAVGLSTRRFADLAAYDAAKKEGLAQDAPSIESVRTSWAGRGLDSFISERDGVINLSKFVVPEDQRGGGVGSAAMNELIAYADATGQRIALTPSKDFGGSSVKRLKGFYKRFGFVENKGRAKDPALSESMYREPAASPLAQTAAVAGADLNDPAQVEDAARLWREMGTESPYFKRWFGESKVVDENGAPLVAYKAMPGSNVGEDYEIIKRQSDFPAFAGAEPGVRIAGFFAADPEVANRFTYMTRPQSPVFPVYLSFQNPYIIDADGAKAGTVQFGETGKPFRDAVRSGKYDGVIIKNTEDEGDIYVALDPTQIKSVFNRGTFDPADPRILMQGADRLGFFSPTAKAIEAMEFNTIPPADLINRIKKAPGVKQEELEDLGLLGWLEGIEGKVSKEQVLEFIQKGGPQLEEVTKAGAGFEGRSARMQELITRENDGTITEEEVYELDDLEGRVGRGEQAFDDTKYSKYQLPGGENYREVLITAPEVTDNFEISQLSDGSWRALSPSGSASFGDTREQAVERARAQQKGVSGYSSSHWDEANVLAHFRLNDRTDADGNKVLFIEEIQSDWHQEGRKKGYAGPLKAISTDVRNEFDILDPSGAKVLTISAESEAAALSVANTQRETLEKGRVPNAPFKKSWNMLAFKRILRMAAEQGYDSVAWTPGEVQAERYDLSKQISLVGYREDMRRSVKNSGRRGELESLLYRVLEDAPRPDLPNIIARMSEKEVEDTILEYSNKPESQRYKNEAVGRLYAENLDGEQVIDERMPPEKVEDYVGKEVAERLFTSEPDKDGYRTLQGLDLKVGGEGMKGFYDKMLPKAVGKYAKKLDKDAKVEVSEVETEAYFDVKNAPADARSDDPAAWMMGKQEVWSLPITDKLREEVLKGQAMYQRPGARPSGANAMVNLKIATPKGSTIVTMFGTEDESSFLHESGHIFFELLGFMARQPGAPQTATEDWQTVLDFVGNDGATPLTREQHEKLARSIEAYFLEGKAPSLRLRQVFQKFADWLKRIYVDFAGLMKIAKQDITPTPEIVALMDRMFATDEEIAQAQNYYGQKDVYEAEAAKIGEEEQAKYLAAVEEAQTEAKDNNTRRRMRAWAKVTGGRKRIEQQVRDEVNAEPVYALMDALRTEENGRLDLDSLSFAVGDEARKALSKKSLTKREGSDPYIRAARFGFASVDEMVTALLNAEKKSERIKAEVDKRMAEAMNELERANTIEGMPVADQDVHTDAKLSVLFMELDMLRKQFAREEAAPERALRSLTVTAKRNAVKAAARRRLEGMKAKDARRYDTFSRAEAQASRESRAALEKGDYMAAEQAKLREIINHAMVIEAVKFREEMAAAEDMVSKAKSQKNMLADSRDLINDIAMRFGFHSAPQSRTAKMFEVYRAQLEAEGNLPNTLLAWADKMEEEGLTVFAPEWIDNTPPRPYQNLMVEQFRDVADAIRSIKTADRMQRIVITDEQGRTREQLIEDLKAAAAQNAKRKARPDRTDSRGRRLVNATHAWHIKMETVLLDLDGGKPGLFWETFYIPFEKAFNEEQTRLKAANEKINELFGRFNTKRQISMSTEKIRIEAIGKSLTKWQAIMAALNMGNEGNMNRLITGEKWSPEQAKAVLDVLEKDEMDFVQEVWDYFDSFREESFALERKLTGRTPKRVEPKPLETRHGVYAGGYFPIVNDPKLGIKAAYRELKDAATGGGSLKGTHHAAAATRRNHLKERTRGTGERLLLDPSVISNHTFQVIHDLTHREAVQGVAQLSRDGKITDILQDYAGFDVTKAMSQWVVDIAAEQNGPQSPIHKFARWARTGTTLMSMGFKATTGVTQFVGYTSTIDQLKAWDKKYAGIGLATVYRNPAKLPTLLRETFEKSKFMEERIKSFDRDIRDATKRIGSSAVESKRLAKALGYVDVAADKVGEFAFAHIGVAQMSVDLPTWWAMYAKVMDETNNEAQAVRAADSFVRQTQGGGATKDLARIQRGDELMRLFTMFYSFFNTLYNMAYLSGRYVQKQGFTRGGVAAAAGSVMWLWFLPSLISELVAGRGPDEDDGEGWAEWALPILALYPMQSIVGLRDAANAIGTKYDYAMTPAQAPLQSFDRWVGAVNKAWEEEDATLLVKPSVEAVGYLMHLPLGQAVITGQNLVDYATGEDPEFYLRDLLFKKPESRR